MEHFLPYFSIKVFSLFIKPFFFTSWSPLATLHKVGFRLFWGNLAFTM